MEMQPPTISDYIGALENPVGIFRTLEVVAVERDIYGDVDFRAGNSAAVFKYSGDGGVGFLKCYIRPNPHLRTIYEYVERRRPAGLPRVRLLPGELYVHSLTGGGGGGGEVGRWVDLVEGEWTEGQTLDVAAARAAKANDKARFGRLAAAFDALCEELSAQEWAHGDLKPENIVVKPDGRLTLIDCDAMWIPALAGQKAVELGTPPYRRPGRTAADFSKRIDDYPATLISAGLHALASSPELLARYDSMDEFISTLV